MSWYQKEIRLNQQRRGKKRVDTRDKLFITEYLGCHLVHSEIMGQLPEIKNIKIGMANFFCNKQLVKVYTCLCN